MEKDRPTPDGAAKKAIEKGPSQVILSGEFASRVNNLVGVMPDEVHLATLFAPWADMIAYRTQKEGIRVSAPSTEWKDFMNSLNHQEMIQLRRLMHTAHGQFDLRTVGDVRAFTAHEDRFAWRIGKRGRAFAALAFKKVENQTVEEFPMEAESFTLGL